MHKGPVGFRHPVQFLPSTDCRSLAAGGIHQFLRQSLPHRDPVTGPGPSNEPAHGKRLAAYRTEFRGHLDGRPTNAFRTHFDGRCSISQCLLEDFQGLSAGFFSDNIERVVCNPLGSRFLALNHQSINESRQFPVIEFRVRRDISFFSASSSRHTYSHLRYLNLIRSPPETDKPPNNGIREKRLQ